MDVDNLPPTQYLVLEVLAARHRLGEQLWTFPASVAPAIRALEQHGLVTLMNGIAPASIRALLTDEGRKHVLLPGYVPPILQERQ